MAPNGMVTQKIYDEAGNLTDQIQFATPLAAPTIATDYAFKSRWTVGKRQCRRPKRKTRRCSCGLTRRNAC